MRVAGNGQGGPQLVDELQVVAVVLVGVAADVRQHLGATVYDTIIPRNVKVSEAPSHGKPVLIYDMRSSGAQAYIRLAREVLTREGQPLAPAAMTQERTA